MKGTEENHINSKAGLVSDTKEAHFNPIEKQPHNRRSAKGPWFVWLLAFIFGFLGGWLAYSVLQRSAIANLGTNKEIVREVVSQKDQDVSTIAKQVGESVVSLKVGGSGNSSGNSFGSSQLYSAAGTGIIVREDGLILTNKHVVSDGGRIEVVMSDGRTFSDAKIVDTDAFNDIAFVKINDVTGLPVATLGDSSSVKVGQTVIAIGNALGEYQNTVTMGIISGIGRPVQTSDSNGSVSSLSNLIQTDTAINPGNSGGPLVNIAGEVIGINTAVADAENIGFSIPINDAKSALKSVEEYGSIKRPYIGVNYLPINNQVKEAFNLDVTRGAFIYNESGTAIVNGSPAEKAGLKDKDVIVSVDGVAVDEFNSLSSLITSKSIGQTVKLNIIRNDEEIEVSVTLDEYQK